MANLTRAYKQLFARPEDERFDSLDELFKHCERIRSESEVHWRLPADIYPIVHNNALRMRIAGAQAFSLNDWSFGQMCSLSDVRKETLNRLRPETAVQVFEDTLPNMRKRYQLLTRGELLRSIHGPGYMRLFDADLLELVMEQAYGFGPPPKGINGGTGLYAGEQDMFAFLIDDTAWVEINGEEFAPGFFVWNSEVGRRTIGIETFWFQRICQNHIVWDAIEVVSYKRKHTSLVAEALDDIDYAIHRLVMKRDERRDAFAKAMKGAMNTSIGSTSEEVTKTLVGQGIPVRYIKEAISLMELQNRPLTIFETVDALTRVSGMIGNAGERVEQDVRIGSLLSLAV